MTWKSFRAFVVLAASIAIAGACRRSGPDAPSTQRTAPGTLEVLKDGRWLFTYMESNGQFATTDKPEVIPAPSRAVVRVFDPSDPSQKSGVGNELYVADVNLLLKSGKAQARPLSREAFETAALAQLPPGEMSPLSARPAHAANEPPPPPMPAWDGGAHATGTPVVTIYGTSW